MEVTSSTTASTSSFGQDYNNGGGDDDIQSEQQQQQTVSSDVALGESGALGTSHSPVELEGCDSHLDTSCADHVAEPLHYGPVMCPDFYAEASVSSYGKDIPDPRAVHGSCGLYNLGNTCFMNSGLQSLMSCSPLVKYFSENFTLDDSTRKTLTGHFYILLCKIWSGQFSVIHPKKFKEFLGLYHSQFEDYRQHDCQEFLAFLLDTLHEQLNVALQPNNRLQLSSSSSSSSAVCSDAAAATSSMVSSACAVAKMNSNLELSAASPMAVSCSEIELSKHHDNDDQHSMGDGRHCDSMGNCNSRKSSSSPQQQCNMGEEFAGGLERKLNHDLEFGNNGRGGKLVSDGEEGSILASEELEQRGRSLIVHDEMLSMSKDGDVDDDLDVITSSGSSSGGGSGNCSGSSSLKRFTSRSNLDDVSSSDIGCFVVKPSLKRVSADTGGVSASGLTFSSEDSNQSSLSVHSTDSEQSSTFKRLKIESTTADLSSSSSSTTSSSMRGSYSNCNSNNNGIASGLKDFAVTSSSDCKPGSSNRRTNKTGNTAPSVGSSGGGEDAVAAAAMPRIGISDESVVSSNLYLQEDSREALPELASVGSVTSPSPQMEMLASDDQDDPMEPSSSPPSIDVVSAKGQLQRLHSLEEYYKKESKTLNTNVLVSDEIDMHDISCDSEKFAKLDNRNRLNSREINLLQEVFDEEDNNSKVDKILIGQQFAIKDTNLHTHSQAHHLHLSTSLVDNIKSVNKPMSTSHKNTIVLNNSYEDDHALSSCHQALSTSSKLHCTSHPLEKETMMLSVPPSLKMDNDMTAGFSKLDEAEKNVQMQAYTKFNTTPPKSNIRIDLTDNQGVANEEIVDEMENESSDEDEMDKPRQSPPLHTPGASSSSMESECSSIPNCLRTCLPSEVSMANEAWQRYKSANDSVVVGTFQGQFRSTVVCSECSNVSVTYEPFMYLSLPIPHAMEQQMCVTFVSHGKPPVRYLLNMMKTDKIGAAKKKLQEMIGLPADDITMAEVLDSHISRILDDNILLKYVNFFNRKIYAFEAVSTPSQVAMMHSDLDNDSSSVHHVAGLNNEDSHSHRNKSILQEDICLVSTSRGDDESGSASLLLLPHRTESQMSDDQSLDSIHVNTPSSRGTMDLGFSDSEMCDDVVSYSSPSANHHHHEPPAGFSPSYFRDDCGDDRGDGAADPLHMLSSSTGREEEGEDDVCQSTTTTTTDMMRRRICSDDDDDGNCDNSNPWINKNLTTETLSANAHCLSWQIVQEKGGDVDDLDETASTVTTVVGSSSSISGDDVVAPCSSSSSSSTTTTKFWVDQPQSRQTSLDYHLSREDSNSVLLRIEKSTIADEDDDYDDDANAEGSNVIIDGTAGNCNSSSNNNILRNGCDSQVGDSCNDIIDTRDSGCATGNDTAVITSSHSVVTSTVTSSSATTITAVGNSIADEMENNSVYSAASRNNFGELDGNDTMRTIANNEKDGDLESNVVNDVNIGSSSSSSNIVNTDTVSDEDNVSVGVNGGLRKRCSSSSGTKSCGVLRSRRVNSLDGATVASSSSRFVEGQREKEVGERPGSYFMQSPCLHTMDSLCHTDCYGASNEQSMTEEDVETKCLTDNWTTFDLGQHPTVDTMPPAPLLSPLHCSGDEKTEEKSDPVASVCDEWRSCAICLEDLPVCQLLTHVNCDGVFCQGCLDMSVKHTADISFFCCPICLQPANVCEDFISLPTSETAKLQARLLTMCLAFRHLVVDNTGGSSLQLVGHPNVIEMASVIAGADLYNIVDRLMGGQGHRVPVLTYSVMLTDGQGLNCSRCPYSTHCTGCEISREGEMLLRPSDNLTIHSCESLSSGEISDMQFAYDDPSMASLRSSEPTTIMDCFGAFTQSEILDEHNPWYCPRCERNQCAKKTMTVWRYPDNLIIHLKRFVYQDLSSTKVDTKVVFPHRGMDVRGFLSGPSSAGLTYDLYSVICHFGGASAGHYTSYALHPLTSQWYYYNDETVSLQSPQDSEYNSGYVLFYQRTGTPVEFTPPQYLPRMEDDPPSEASTTAASAATTSITSFSTFQQQSTSSSTTTSTSTTTTTTDTSHTNSSSSSDNSSGNSSMALVPFVPPTSTTSSSNNDVIDQSSTKNTDVASSASGDDGGDQHEWNSDTNVNPNKSNVGNSDSSNNNDKDYDDDDDDDYDCSERRCSPSSDYGSLLHFDSSLPDLNAHHENRNSINSNALMANYVNHDYDVDDDESQAVHSNSLTTNTRAHARSSNTLNLNREARQRFQGRGISSSGFALDRSPAANDEPDSTYDIFSDEFGF